MPVSEKLEKFLANLGQPQGKQADDYNRLIELDFPTTRNEYWKYTKVGKIANGDFQIPNSNSQIANLDVSIHLVSANYLVIENGIVREDLSNLGSYSVEVLKADTVDDFSPKLTPAKDDIFNTLNLTYFYDRIVIENSENIEEPLQIIFIESGSKNISNARLQVRVKKSTNCNLVQTFVSEEGSENFVNLINQYHVEENARLSIDLLQNPSNSTAIVSTTEVYQEQNSNFKINTATVSGQLIRNNINIAVDGQNCETFMNGAVVTKDKMHVDNHTFVDHKVPHCESNENYKYVLNDSSTGVFNGKVIVRQDAQVINAYQNNGNIVLSDKASINSKPELEIYADDVKCSHGSTTGQLDDDALFYLQSRGISKEGAKQMLVSAFVKEVIDEIENEKVLGLIEAAIQKEHGWSF